MKSTRALVVGLLLIVSSCIFFTPPAAHADTTEDFTTYTETDPASKLTIDSSTQITAGLRRNDKSYIYKDKGVDGIGNNFIYHVRIYFTSYSSNYVHGLALTFANSVASFSELSNTFGIEVYRGASSTTLRLNERYSSTEYASSGYTLSTSTNYYCKVVKVGTSVTLYVYSDSGETTLLGSYSLTLHENVKYRYLYACTSYYQDTSTNQMNLVIYSIVNTPYTASVTITSNPAGSGFVSVDGTNYTTPHTFTWNPAEVHTLVAYSPIEAVANEKQYVYTSWSDSGAQTHNYTVSADATITANYKTQYKHSLESSPSGLILRQDTTNRTTTYTTGWIDSGTSIQLYAYLIQSGYVFDSWADNGLRNHTVTPTAHTHYTATFQELPNNGVATVNISGNATITLDGTPVTTPDIFNFTAGEVYNITATSEAGGEDPLGVDLTVTGNATITVDGSPVSSPYHFLDGTSHSVVANDIYTPPPDPVTIDIDGVNATIAVDGFDISLPRTYNWNSGDSHTIYATGSGGAGIASTSFVWVIGGFAAAFVIAYAFGVRRGQESIT